VEAKPGDVLQHYEYRTACIPDDGNGLLNNTKRYLEEPQATVGHGDRCGVTAPHHAASRVWSAARLSDSATRGHHTDDHRHVSWGSDVECVHLLDGR